MPSLIPPLQSIWGVERGDSKGDSLGNIVEQVKAAICAQGKCWIGFLHNII